MLLSILQNIKFKGRLDIINYRGVLHRFGEGDDYSKIRFTNKSIENKIFRNPSLYLGEGYMNKEIIIEEGSLDNFLKIITASYEDFVDHNKVFKIYEYFSSILKPFQQINRLVQSKKNVAHHYDLNEDMYN